MTPEARAQWLLRGGLALGALHVLLWVVVAYARATYSFDVEWMEGGELMHAVRLLEGKAIYAAPSVEFTAFFYPPGYPAVVAALASGLGDVSYALGRAVSIASTVLTLGLLYWVVKRNTIRPFALLAVALYAALDRVSGTFTTVARPDALAYAFVFAAAVVARYGSSPASAIGAALLGVAAAYTKQTTVVLDLGIAAWLLWKDRRRGAIYTAILTVLGGTLALALNRATDGYFLLYVVSGHQEHAFFWSNAVFYFYRDLLFLAPLLLLVPVAWGVTSSAAAMRRAAGWMGLLVVAAFIERAFNLGTPAHMYFREIAYQSPSYLLLFPPLLIAVLLGGAVVLNRTVGRNATVEVSSFDPYWVGLFVLALVAGALGHATQWAYKNAFLPTTLFGSVFVCLAAYELWQRSALAASCVAAALSVQLIALADAPSSRMPSAEDHQRVESLRERLAEIPGDKLVLAHPLLAYEDSGQVHFHQMSLSDVAQQGGVKDFDQALAEHRWSAVVSDEGDGLGPPASVQRHYRLVERLDGPTMKTGVRVHPAALWLPK
jgi:hypothetical protein